MSVSIANIGRASYQPFECLVCQSRFTRHENLKRHAALHSRSHDKTVLSCDLCQATFSRHDLRHRHMKRKHPEHGTASKSRTSRFNTATSSQRCSDRKAQRDKTASLSPTESSGGWDLGNEVESGRDTTDWHTDSRYEQHQSDNDNQGDFARDTNFTTGTTRNGSRDDSRIMTDMLTVHPSISESMSLDRIMQDAIADEQGLRLGESLLNSTAFGMEMQPMPNHHSHSVDPSIAGLSFNSAVPDKLLAHSPPQTLDDWSPSATHIARGCDLFFTYVAHFVPFLHQATFDSSQAPPHLLLSMLSLAYQHGEDPDCGNQTGSGASLSALCYHHARALIASEEDAADEPAHHNTLVQAYLLLQICAMMYLCGKDSSSGLKMHSKMISHARIGGLMQAAPPEHGAAGDLESLWHEFIRTESRKRTIFAVHQIDALWYQFLSIPRQLSHLEIKHDLPCPEQQWTAASAAEWAHQQLISRQASSPVKYTDAVRRFLSSEADLDTIPSFDPYGAINITQFLISSAREISGWSTMTGVLSLERFEPLRSSLVKLGPFIRQEPATATATASHAALCEATWETAMIELQVWSPSHVGGIVEGSIDALLNSSTYLSPHVELLCESTIAKAVQPHVDWFLRYLDTTITPDFEAPWVTLYAYKAFLIAWQLVRGGKSGSMQVVGVSSGDVDGALTWARMVFQRRQRWQLGKLILACLDSLGK